MATQNARKMSRSKLPGAPWRISETETRIAIKSGKRTIAYMQMAASDQDLATAICAVPAMIEALQRCVRQGDLPLGVDAAARAALADAGFEP